MSPDSPEFDLGQEKGGRKGLKLDCDPMINI